MTSALKFNILHTETLKRWGGQQNRVLSEAIGLKHRGHDVIIACNRDSVLAEKAGSAGIKVYELNMTKPAHIVNIPRLIRIIRKERIDIVSTHSSVDSWAGGIAAKLTGTKLIRFRHNLYQVGKDPLTRFIYSIPDRIIAISREVKNVLTRNGIRDDRITVIPSSVDINVFNNDAKDLRKALNIPADTVVIGNTSTFTYVKGQETLLRAFNSISRSTPCILLFAGRLPDSKKSKYLDHVNKEFQKNVILTGHRDDISRVLKTIDIFVYPSILEGLGTALLEAMAMRRPVVISDIPTFREFIEDGINGIFFRTNDPEDLAEKVSGLLRNRGLMKKLGENAGETILKNFTVEKMIEDTEAFYRNISTAGKKK